MPNIPLELHEIDGISWYKTTDSSKKFAYIPPSPRPQVGPDGTPMASLMTHTAGGMLQVSAQWKIETEELQAVYKNIARIEGLDAEDIQLTLAPVNVKAAKLWLGDGETVKTLLQTNTTAASFPHSAIFNAILTKPQANAAAASLAGREKFLKVCYDVSLPVIVQAGFSLKGDASEVTTHDDLTLDQALEWIKQALDKQDLDLIQFGSAPADSALWSEAKSQVINKAAEVLLELSQKTSLPHAQQESSSFQTAITLEDTVESALDACTDVAQWLIGRPLSAIQIVGTLPQAETTEVPSGTVRITPSDEWPQELPIAFIRVACGEAIATLKPPNFAAVELACSDGPLNITTHYSSGGDSYTHQLDSTQSNINLNLSDLGLVNIKIDASARQEAGAKKLRIDVAYFPEGNGERGRESFYFRDDTWTSDWVIITRAPSLAGTLEYEFKETSANSQITHSDELQTTESNIILKY